MVDNPGFLPFLPLIIVIGSLVTMKAFLGTKNLHDNFITLLGVSI